MAAGAVQIKPKQLTRDRKPLIRAAAIVMLIIVTAAAGLLIFDRYSGAFGIVGPHFEIEQTSKGRIIHVPPGGSVQAALAQAESGDIIELKAGAAYYGPITLPNKPLTETVTIRSSAADQLPVDQRVSPKDAPLMAKLVSRSEKPVVTAVNGAHDYRFIGIEFTAQTKSYIYNLVLFGNGESAANIPYHLEIDRSYLHPSADGITRRGIALNSGGSVIKNSYIEGFAGPSEETQGICGWTGTRDVKILNNYIEGGAENIMFGGSDPDSADLTPNGIEIRGNHLNKPEAWKSGVTVKTLFELKNAKRVQFIGNLIENNYKGSAFRITVRNQDGHAPFSTIEDVVIRDNIIRNSGDGINILGHDDQQKSGTLRNLVIENNLFLNLAGGNGFDGSGYLIQAAAGDGITIANNTAFNMGNIVTFYGEIPSNFVFRDNIVGHGEYGIHGPIDLNSASAKAMFRNNLFMNLNRVSPGDHAFPAGNMIVQSISDVGFVNATAGDYRLSPTSKYRGKATGGKDLGCALPPTSPH